MDLPRLRSRLRSAGTTTLETFNTAVCHTRNRGLSPLHTACVPEENETSSATTAQRVVKFAQTSFSKALILALISTSSMGKARPLHSAWRDFQSKLLT